MFEDMFRELFKAAVVLVVIVAGAAFGIGYGCRGCDYAVRVPWEKTTAGRGK